MITITVQGVEKLGKKRQRVPLAARPMFEAAAQYGQARMKIHAKPHPADKGTLAEGVEIELSAGGAPLSAKVGFVSGGGVRSSLANLAATVNYGRGPGKPPSLQAVRRWLESHGYAANPRDVQKAIAASGTKGVLFVERAADELDKRIPELIEEAIEEIEKGWGS